MRLPRISRLLILPIVFLFVSAAPIQDQILETEHYRVSIPAGWEIIKKDPGLGPEFSFNPTKWQARDTTFDGKVLPVTFNHKPVYSGGYLSAVKAPNLEEAVTMTMRYYRGMRDRSFVRDDYTVEDLVLNTGDTAAFVKTRSSIMSQDLQQTRYDLFVYNKKLGHAHNLVLIFSYHDPKYVIEQQSRLDEHVKKMFSTFAVK